MYPSAGLPVEAPGSIEVFFFNVVGQCRAALPVRKLAQDAGGVVEQYDF